MLELLFRKIYLGQSKGDKTTGKVALPLKVHIHFKMIFGIEIVKEVFY